MNSSLKRFSLIATLTLATAAPIFTRADEPKKSPPQTKLAWTLDEALARLRLNPHDAYLQYVAMQLGRRDGKHTDVANQIDHLTQRNNNWQGAERRGQVDLFSIFTGALAVQESLQLDTMRGNRPANARGPQKKVLAKDLKGPTIKSHPWKKMLAGKNPAVSEIARMVPANNYLVQCKSLTKLLELADFGDVWATHLFNQAAQDATTNRVGERLKEQLAVRSDGLTRPFYDLVVDQVAITGSDLFVREGSDVTIIFQVKQSEVFRARMDGYLSEAAEKNPAVVKSGGKLLGVEYVKLASPDRRVHVFSAYPRPNLHVRSNSQVGLERVLAAILEPTGVTPAIERLGETDEFKYIRTLMPEGAKEEDVFIYLSDSFIRHMVGPKLKLTERRRLIAYNDLRMLGHGSMLYRTQFGKEAGSFDELLSTACVPLELVHAYNHPSFGGKYERATAGDGWFCSSIGSTRELLPNIELPLDDVTQQEADEYQAFREQYDQYWRTFFDPIAVRVQMTPERYRVETIVLPLIDNSIYSGLASTLGGEPELLDALPVPKGNIFSVGLKLQKKAVLAQWGISTHDLAALRDLTALDDDKRLRDFASLSERFMRDGIGEQVGLHLYDSTQTFDFNAMSFLGQSVGSFGGRGGWFSGNDMLWISMLVASLNSPVYVSLPVKDAKVVDEFLDALDPVLALQARRPPSGWWLDTQTDFYKLEPLPGDKSPLGKDASPVRGFSLSFGPLKWRFFYARIGEGLYFASKRFVLDEIATATAARQKDSAGASPSQIATGGNKAHAMLRLRPENWQQVLPDFKLGWAENNRRAVLNNLGRLSNVARAHVAQHPDAVKQDAAQVSEAILRSAAEVYGCQFTSPDGGQYVLAPDGKSVAHTLYGSELAPKQTGELAKGGEMARLMQQFAGATAELTFVEDGLHAVLTIDRK